MEERDVLIGQGVQPASEQAEVPQPHPESASMESLLEAEGLGLDFPKQGEIRTGVVATLGESEILVSVGTKS
jgi:small subunit ribosomal protein S1